MKIHDVILVFFISALALSDGSWAIAGSPEDICKHPRRSWLSPEPPPLFSHDLGCLYFVRMPELTATESCSPIRMQDIYPTFDNRLDLPIDSRSLPPKATPPYIFHAPVKPEVAQPGINLERHALAFGYCHRQNAGKLKEVFMPEHDVPAGIISLWTKDYLRHKWEPKLNSPELMKSRTDFPMLYDLNLAAADLWTEMTSCYHGNAEAARRAYFQARFECPNPAVDGNQLRENVASYINQVRDFFLTGGFDLGQLLVTSELELASKLMKDEPIIEVTAQEAPSLHPLFIQAALQLLTEIYPIGERPSMKRFDKKMRGKFPKIDPRLSSGISQLITLVPEFDCSPLGLWPSASRAAYRSILVTAKKLVYSAQRYVSITFKPVPIPTGCIEKKLAPIYLKKSDDIAIEMREISERYSKVSGNNW